jgi:hypothetical protein
MNPEQQRIAIAKACGWKFIPDYCHGKDEPPEFTTITPDGRHLCGYYPDYLNDLNAMNSAVLEKFNGPAPDGWAFIDNLRVACGIPHSSTCMALVCAAAEQRAEAFLKTLNLWADEPKETISHITFKLRHRLVSENPRVVEYCFSDRPDEVFTDHALLRKHRGLTHEELLQTVTVIQTARPYDTTPQ